MAIAIFYVTHATDAALTLACPVLLVNAFTMGCRMLNIEDLQNAELWQRAGLLTADKQLVPQLYDGKQAAASVMQPTHAQVLS